MVIARDDKSVAVNGRGGAPHLELQLSRATCEAGQQLSGVVVFHLSEPTAIRALIVTVSGRETPAGASLSRSLKRSAFFFQRDILLSGMEQPRFTHERVSQLWNAFLGRATGRILSLGEHTYPFSIPLPASLPPSYEGKAGKVAYMVAVKAHYPLGRTLRVVKNVTVAAVPRAQRIQPVALTYPNANSAVHVNEISLTLELPGRAVALGERICGKFSVSNPKRVPIREVSIALENYEWVRLAAEKELQRQTTDHRVIKPENPEAPSFESNFELEVPINAAPTVEGTTISVIWLLRMRLDTDPPVDFRMPFFVYSPMPK